MDLISLIIALVLAGCIFWLLIWFIDWAGIPEPFNKIIKVLIGMAVVLYLLGILTGYTPHPGVFLRR